MDSITLRRKLHSAPELSFKEELTASTIEAALSEAGITHSRVATTGVLARIEGRGDLKRAVVLRADIDALPIEEQTSLEFASQNSGVMHACGHDMHAAILYGALCALKEQPTFEGTIFGLFQPGEECNPGGASLVLSEEPFAEYDVVAVVGEHVDSRLEVGEIGVRAGQFMASSDELRFTINGRGGHAARRSELKDPVAAMAELITALLSLNSADVVLSLGRVEALGATNVIPHIATLEGTLRTFNEKERRHIKDQIALYVENIATKHNLEIENNLSQGFPSVVNDEALTAKAQVVAQQLCHVVPFERLNTSEDFGFYSVRYPSLFYRLGVGRKAGAPHTSTFSPNEAAIPLGVELMKALALNFIGNEKEERQER